MLLELDAGNTRVKWRLSTLGAAGAGSRIASGAVPGREPEAVLAQLLSELEAALAPAGGVAVSLQRILVSSVRDAEFRAVCAALLERCFGTTVEFAAAQEQCAGLRSGYREPLRLGVDRWLAMLAAFSTAQAACCILDCGTTITLDVVRADGQHLGGYIVPGLMLMREALAARSPALVNPALLPATAPGQDTAEAIAHGSLAMALGFVRDQQRLLQQQLGAVRWYCCGGDAPLLLPQLDWDCRLEPDLVLDGLRLALL
jgi:type III pantothenate kinase